eukprot:g20941.t1
METLDCNCSKMVGCIHPFDFNIDQLYHMMVVAVDENGDDYVPEFAWEIFWSAQIVEDGVFKEKYYGGLSTSMTFEYSRLPETYELVGHSGLWGTSSDAVCHDCVDSPADPMDYSTFASYVESTDKVGTYGAESVSAYMSTSCSNECSHEHSHLCSDLPSNQYPDLSPHERSHLCSDLSAYFHSYQYSD